MKADRGKILLRLGFLAVTPIALYILWPSLLTVLETWPDLAGRSIRSGPLAYAALEFLRSFVRTALHGCRYARNVGSPSPPRNWPPMPSVASCREVPPPEARSSTACSPKRASSERRWGRGSPPHP